MIITVLLNSQRKVLVLAGGHIEFYCKAMGLLTEPGEWRPSAAVVLSASLTV